MPRMDYGGLLNGTRGPFAGGAVLLAVLTSPHLILTTGLWGGSPIIPLTGEDGEGLSLAHSVPGSLQDSRTRTFLEKVLRLPPKDGIDLACLAKLCPRSCCNGGWIRSPVTSSCTRGVGRVLCRDALSRSKYSDSEAIKKKQGSQVPSALFFSPSKLPLGPKCLCISVSIYWVPTSSSELFQGSRGDKRLNLIEWTANVSWMNRGRQRSNPRMKGFRRGACLTEKSSSVWIGLRTCAWTSRFRGTHVSLGRADGWLVEREASGDERARLTRTGQGPLSRAPGDGSALGRLSCDLSGIHSLTTCGDVF